MKKTGKGHKSERQQNKKMITAAWPKEKEVMPRKKIRREAIKWEW